MNRGNDDKPAAAATNRATVMTMQQELLKVSPAVSDGDVAIPAGFKPSPKDGARLNRQAADLQQVARDAGLPLVPAHHERASLFYPRRTSATLSCRAGAGEPRLASGPCAGMGRDRYSENGRATWSRRAQTLLRRARVYAATISIEDLNGNSPKFQCRVAPARRGGDDDVKVKFGINNGEVYGEVAASRLLWALGFGADRMYPVRVICRGCPEDVGGEALPDGSRVIDPAVVERPMPHGGTACRIGADLVVDGARPDRRRGGRSYTRATRCVEAARRVHPAHRHQTRTAADGVCRGRPT